MITASSGVALTVVLSVIMEGIIIGGGVSGAAIAILSRLWIVGLIPVLVGSALIVNGIFVSPRGKNELGSATSDDTPAEIGPAVATNLLDQPFSVTDETTRQLQEPVIVERIKTK